MLKSHTIQGDIMIEHTVHKVNLNDPEMFGKMLIVSENFIKPFECNLRQFIIQNRRNYSSWALEALAEEEQLHHSPHSSVEAPYFHIRLILQPPGDLQDFLDEHEESLLQNLFDFIGYSSYRGISGKRSVFVSDFDIDYDMTKGNVIVSDILVGTSVFFNDYRVTSGFPANDSEAHEVVGHIYKKIAQNWPQLKIETTFNLLT